MFPRDQRLRTTTDILVALRKGTRRSTPMLACSFISKPGTLSRVTVIVNTKVAKKAVDRNLLKRRLRSLLRTYTLPIGDLVVQTRAGSPALNFQELAQQLDQCLQPIIKTQFKR